MKKKAIGALAVFVLMVLAAGSAQAVTIPDAPSWSEWTAEKLTGYDQKQQRTLYRYMDPQLEDQTTESYGEWQSTVPWGDMWSYEETLDDGTIRITSYSVEERVNEETGNTEFRMHTTMIVRTLIYPDEWSEYSTASPETKEYRKVDKLTQYRYRKLLDNEIRGKGTYSRQCGSTFQLKLTSETGVRYSIIDGDMASVSSSGLVTVKKPGTIHILAISKAKDGYRQVYRTLVIHAVPEKVMLSAKKKTRTSVRISWKKASGAGGYEVWIYSSKKKKYVLAVRKTADVHAVTHSGLVKGRTYRYKVRAYAVFNGKKIYGPFSKVRKIRIT